MVTWLPQGYSATTVSEVKRSRFLTTLARADSEDAARSVVAEARRAYPDARHHCSAFVVDVAGANRIERSSDDGEPAGTAGMPMLEVLRGAVVSNVVAVVTRHFGGVLLGTGGLVRAYSEAVAAALAQAPRVIPVARHLFTLHVDHARAGRLQSELLTHQVDIVSVAYGADVELTLATDDPASLARLVAHLTKGAGRLEAAGSRVVEIPAD